MAAAHPAAVAWHNLADGSDLTFATWDADANRLARGLADRGLEPGGPGGHLHQSPTSRSRGSPPIPPCTAPVPSPFPLNARLAGPELRPILAHADPAAILASSATGGGTPWPELAADVAGRPVGGHDRRLRWGRRVGVAVRPG